MRSHYCGQVDESLLDQEVQLCGWANRRRDHGGVIFIDLRDREGIVQVVYDPDRAEIFQIAEQVRSEFVLQITGRVRHRPAGTINSKIASGTIEILGTQLTILNPAEPPPFPLDDNTEVHEETRLRHRYIDLRRPEMLQRMRLRAQVNAFLRGFLEKHNFMEMETPILTKATPEGARDYLVPSRTHPGTFFALPQSPQIFKQLLMVAGMDRYYQIVRCFRDEDLRADRQPEFTQLDIETSFLDEAEITNLMEEMIRSLFSAVLATSLPSPFPRMRYAEAIERFGVDRPDLRNPLELIEVSDLLQDVDFKVFAGPAKNPQGRVAVLRVPGGTRLTRKKIDEYTKFVSKYGAKGLAYIKVNDLDQGKAGLQSPILKFLPETATAEILKRCGAKSGDLLFFGADQAKIVNEALGALRVQLGIDLDLLEEGWRPVWIIDFPMFEKDEARQRWNALHHPFTAPQSDVASLQADPGACLSRAYDLVLNGSEIGGGSIRIHQQETQSAVFTLLGINEEEANDKFGFLLEALKYGCPPHGGIAFGLDRLLMLMSHTSSIREVIAFPKTQTAHCPLTAAPTVIDEPQLRELGIRVRTQATHNQ